MNDKLKKALKIGGLAALTGAGAYFLGNKIYNVKARAHNKEAYRLGEEIFRHRTHMDDPYPPRSQEDIDNYNKREDDLRRRATNINNRGHEIKSSLGQYRLIGGAAGGALGAGILAYRNKNKDKDKNQK